MASDKKSKIEEVKEWRLEIRFESTIQIESWRLLTWVRGQESRDKKSNIEEVKDLICHGYVAHGIGTPWLIFGLMSIKINGLR
jgi:hypothetical protein